MRRSAAVTLTMFRTESAGTPGRVAPSRQPQRRRNVEDFETQSVYATGCRTPKSPHQSRSGAEGRRFPTFFDNGGSGSLVSSRRTARASPTASSSGGFGSPGSISPTHRGSRQRCAASATSSPREREGGESASSLLSLFKQVREPPLPGAVQEDSDEDKGVSDMAPMGRISSMPSLAASSHRSAQQQPRSALRSTKVSLSSNEQSQASPLLRWPSDAAPAAFLRPQDKDCFSSDGSEVTYCGVSSLLARRRASCPNVAALSSLALDRSSSVQSPKNGREGKGSPAAASSPRPPPREIVSLKPGEKIYDLYYWDEVLQEEGHGGKVVSCIRKVQLPREASDGAASTSASGSGSSGDGCSSVASAALSPTLVPTMKEGSDDVELVMKIKAKKELREVGAEEQFRKAQMRLLNLPPHEGVLALREVLEDDTFYYVVMEKAKGGSLFCSLMDEYTDGNMPAEAVKGLMKEILEAIGHVHEQGMLHRDIKPDNLVVQIATSPAVGKIKKVKVIDFDVADPEWCPASPTKLEAYVGTLRHSAPESFRGIFSERTDLYSVGTILYLIMAGKLPYPDEIFDRSVREASQASLLEMYEQMRQTPVDWAAAVWEGQPQCMDFCKHLLAFDAMDRFASADEALAHPWLADVAGYSQASQAET